MRRQQEAEPDFAGVDEAFPTLRHLSYHASYAAMARQRPDWIKDTITWEIAEAERQTAADVAAAVVRQNRMYADSSQLFQRHEYVVLPVTQVEPFDVTIAYPTQIAGQPMRTYIDWMRSCWYITFMANPAISGVHDGRIASGFADRRPPPQRLECVAACACIRAGHTAWGATPGARAAALDRPSDDRCSLNERRTGET
jgi:hypothetical protein